MLYIPTNKHNLISLGCWDKATGQYMGGGSLIMKNGKHVTMGNKINNNLYKMQMTTCHHKDKSPEALITFLAEEPVLRLMNNKEDKPPVLMFSTEQVNLLRFDSQVVQSSSSSQCSSQRLPKCLLLSIV